MFHVSCFMFHVSCFMFHVSWVVNDGISARALYEGYWSRS